MMRSNWSRASPGGLSALAMWAIFSSSRVPLTSEAPKSRASEAVAQALGEDLCAAARHGAEAGCFEPDEGLPGLDLPAPPEVVDLGGGEGLDLRLRAGGVDGGDHALEVLEGPVRVMAPRDVDLARARLDHREHVLDGVLEGPCLPRLPREIAE